jgi:integrase
MSIMPARATKRSSNSKGIRLDPKTGKYIIRWTQYVIDAGQRKRLDRERVVGTDKRTAQLMLEEIKQKIRLEKLKAGSTAIKEIAEIQKPRTFAEAASDYLAERSGKDYKQSSKSQYESIIKCHLLPSFADCNIREMSHSVLMKFKAQLSTKVEASRLNTVMSLLKSIMSQEFKQGNLDRDPTLAVPRAQESKTEIDPLSEDELKLALDAIDPHYRPLFITLAYTGARPNELLALRWADIDWVKQEIDIKKGRVRGHEGKPKTQSSERRIPMLAQVLSCLTALKDSQQVVSLDGYVFTSKKGAPIDKHLDRIWARALKKAGLKHRPSYQLRHTFATQCIIKGMALPFVSKILGHSTMDTLIRHYAGWINQSTQNENDKLRAAFAPSTLQSNLNRA